MAEARSSRPSSKSGSDTDRVIRSRRRGALGVRGCTQTMCRHICDRQFETAGQVPKRHGCDRADGQLVGYRTVADSPGWAIAN